MATKMSNESTSLHPSVMPEVAWTDMPLDAVPVKADSGPLPSARSEMTSVFWTFATTLTTFAIFLIQGIILARILLPEGRGQFGTAIFFPRDVLLYAGLLGGIEVANTYASRLVGGGVRLKYSAARMGLLSGTLTGIAGALLAWGTIWFNDVMQGDDKWFLLPYCLVCCLFVPLEHMQLNISAVDRGKKNYAFYNWNRLLFALAFPVLMVAVYGLELNRGLPFSDLTIICFLFLLSKVIGLLPTLRGMDLGSVLFGQDSRRTEVESSEVPGALTLLSEGRGYAVSMLATELFERLDVLLIVALAPVVESGYYFVAVPVAAILTVAPNALGVFTFNAGADPSRRVSLKLAGGVMAATAALQILVAIVYSLVMPFLIITLFKPDFAQSVPYALWLLPACAMKGFLQAADGFLKGCGRPLIGVWARAFSIVVMLAFIAIAFASFADSIENQWLFIPMAACVGQFLSLLLISVAVLREVQQRESAWATDANLISEAH